MKYVFFDTETTGLVRVSTSQPSSLWNNGDEVIQIGGLVADDRMKPEYAFCHFCDCLKPEVSEGAAKVNHLSMREIRKYVPDVFLSQVLSTCVPVFFEPDVTFAGYNSGFDMQMVDQTIRDSSVRVDWGTKVLGPILPSFGRNNVDVAEFFRTKNGKYPRLSSLMNTEMEEYQTFMRENVSLPFYSNAYDLIRNHGMHSSYVDSICTFILWRDYLWKKKLH